MPVEIIMPKFGFTLETSEIVKWLKHEGEAVESGEPICEVTTDKVNMEVEAPADGTLYKVLYGEGDTVDVTAVIAYLLALGEEPPASLPDPAPRVAGGNGEADRKSEPTSSVPTSATAVTPVARRLAEAENVDLRHVQGTGPGNRITRQDVKSVLTRPVGKLYATPAARRIASETNVDLGMIPGTGPKGRIQGTDVQAFIEAQKTQPTAAPAAMLEIEEREIVQLEGMRRTIATRLQHSFQTAPHIFVEVQVDATAIEALRQRLKEREQKLSVTAILIKACAGALKRHSWINATLEGEEISLWSSVNIGMAVALESGLIVPVIHQAEQRSLQAIQEAVSDLAGKARNDALTLADVTGGTFTISNMGMLGVNRFTAIINPPQVAILAVGRTVQQFLPDAEGQPVLRSTINLVLSADHRVVDGAQAAYFLDDLRIVLEDPALLAW